MTPAALVARCAPNVGPVTMSAIVAYESGARPFAIGDNTAHRSYFPAKYPAAVALADRLIARGDDIDVGYAQINVSNFGAYGLDAASALLPCRNVSIGARILQACYGRAVRVYGAGQLALAHALSAYNTGGLEGGGAYARGVWREAARLRASPRRAVTFVRGRPDGRAIGVIRGAAERSPK